MNMATYCKSHGMTLEQYKQYEQNIKTSAAAIYELSKAMHKHDTGVYWPITDIIPWNQNTNKDNELFIITELKKLNMEFITEDNKTYYRA